MKIIRSKEKEYKSLFNKNIDTDGIYCYTLAERWADLMEKEIDNSSKSPYEIICDNANNLFTRIVSERLPPPSISDSLYYYAIFILIEFWIYGKFLALYQREKATFIYNMIERSISLDIKQQINEMEATK